MRQRFLWIGLFISICLEAGSEWQDPISFQHITLEDGLSQNTVYAIIQDRVGFIWLGTNEGLNRFDGYDFKIYKPDPENHRSIGGSWIRSLCEDNQGRIWIGTRNKGLTVFDPGREQFSHFTHHANQPDTISHNDVYAVCEDRDGLIWIGTRQGLNRLDPESGIVKRFHLDPDKPDRMTGEWISDLLVDAGGTLWIGHDQGLKRWDREREIFVSVVPPGYETGFGAVKIHESRKGGLYLGDLSGRVFFYNKGNFELFFHQEGMWPEGITRIMEDRLGHIWIGGLRDGLMVKRPEGFIKIVHRPEYPHSLTQNDVRSVFEDRSGVIWVGTDAGLNKFSRDNNRFRLYQSLPNGKGLSTNWVWSVCKDVKGVVWVGTDYHGLDLLDRETGVIRHIRHNPDNPSGLSNDTIRTIARDHRGDMWVGTYGGGLDRVRVEDLSSDPMPFGHRRPEDGLAGDRISVLLEDRNKQLWVGIIGGLSRLDPSREHIRSWFHNPDDPESLSSLEVLSLCEDSRGTVWIGTRKGLNRYDPRADAFRSWQHEADNPTGISHDLIRSLHADQQGMLWLGTYGGGLNRFDPETGHARHFTEKDGLPNNVIYGILGDTSGHLWMSTNRGICRFDLSDYSFRTYQVSDGLQGFEFNSGAFFQAEDGELFFGGGKGLNSFFPKDTTDNLISDKTVLTRFSIFNRPTEIKAIQPDSPLELPIYQTRDLTLSHKERVFTLDFAALNFTDPGANRYAFKLDGLEDHWNYTSARRRFATYTNLSPGSYTFRVKGTNHDGVWARESVALQIRVKPPLWRTWWAYAVYGLIPFVASALYYRTQQRIKRHLEQEVLRRTETLKATQKELLATAHKAGMAEIAVSVLHNVGNVLNSISTRGYLIREGLDPAIAASLGRANGLLVEHAGDLTRFLEEDPKGRMLLPFYASLADKLEKNNNHLSEHVDELLTMINTIKDVVARQQQYASGGVLCEPLDLEELVDTTLAIYEERCTRESVAIIRNFEETPKIMAQKTRLVHTLASLMENACEAIKNSNGQGVISLELCKADDRVRLTICDNGEGIDQENLTRIFAHGFSTWSGRQGFGLHYCALALHEMGAQIEARSNENSQGASMILHFPTRIES